MNVVGECHDPMATADGYDSTDFALSENDAGTGVQIVLGRRCHLRVVAPGHPDASFVVLDERDEPLIVRQLLRGGMISMRKWRLEHGLSQVLTATDRARTVVLRENGREVARQSVALRPGVVTNVRW